MRWNPMNKRPLLIVKREEYPDGCSQAFSETVSFLLTDDGHEAKGTFWVTHFLGGKTSLSCEIPHAKAWRFLDFQERALQEAIEAQRAATCLNS